LYCDGLLGLSMSACAMAFAGGSAFATLSPRVHGYFAMSSVYLQKRPRWLLKRVIEDLLPGDSTDLVADDELR